MGCWCLVLGHDISQGSVGLLWRAVGGGVAFVDLVHRVLFVLLIMLCVGNRVVRAFFCPVISPNIPTHTDSGAKAMPTAFVRPLVHVVTAPYVVGVVALFLASRMSCCKVWWLQADQKQHSPEIFYPHS